MTRGGSLGDAARRVFGDGQNPLSWALPLYTAWGITVKLHLFFLIYLVGRLLMSLPQDRMGPLYAAMSMSVLFGLVLLHEYGHCFACRRVGGEASEILLWPLGGLAMCIPPHDWRANLITTLGGPAVNAVLAPVFGVAVLLVTKSWGSVIFNPFDPSAGLFEAVLADGTQPWWLVGLWWLYFMNVVLFAFNMLVPMYPMDAGRVVHAILWRTMGYERATDIATTIGYVAAGVLAVVAIVGEQTFLLALAIFGAFYCWQEKRQLGFARDPSGIDLSAAHIDPDKPRGPTKFEQKRMEKERKHQVEVDRILSKISTEGMGMLTKGEKKTLERESEGMRGP